MKGELATLTWQMSDSNPFLGAGERTIRGEDNWGRSYNPNFTLPGFLGPWIIGQYMSGAAAAHAFLASFTRASFIAAIDAESDNGSQLP